MYTAKWTRHNVPGTIAVFYVNLSIQNCNSRLRLLQFSEFHCSKYLISGMLDGPARPMTGIQGAGYPGTAQVLQYVQFTVYSVQYMLNCILYSTVYTVHFTVRSYSAAQWSVIIYAVYICTIYTRYIYLFCVSDV